MIMALTREISPAIVRCELTHLDRVPIDVARARAQHADYEWALVEAGCTVRRLHAGDEMADSVFIEDIAVVFDELAIITRPGAPSRRAETPGVVDALARLGGLRYRPQFTIDEPGTLDGGDVVVIGRQVFVGLSERTNEEAVEQLRDILAQAGYIVRAAPLAGCLHLKSAVTAIGPGTLLINRCWTDADLFEHLELIDIDPDEPYAANALRLPDRLIYPTAFPKTRKRLEDRGYSVRTVDVSELAKAEGAVTCCSLLVNV